MGECRLCPSARIGDAVVVGPHRARRGRADPATVGRRAIPAPCSPACKAKSARQIWRRPQPLAQRAGWCHLHPSLIPDGVREVHEELGLPVAYGDLHPIGLRQTAVTLAPDYIEREFQHWHLLPLDLDLDLDAIPLAFAEVSSDD